MSKDSILNTTGKKYGRHWRIVRVVSTPLSDNDPRSNQTDRPYHMGAEEIWSSSAGLRRYDTVMYSPEVLGLLHREVPLFAYVLNLPDHDAWYVLQVKKQGEWHTVIQLRSMVYDEYREYAGLPEY